MAEKLHISQSAYARIESGESHSWAAHIEKLSEIFEMIEQYKERIKELKEQVEYWKNISENNI